MFISQTINNSIINIPNGNIGNILTQKNVPIIFKHLTFYNIKNLVE